jgi:hypothetical protein
MATLQTQQEAIEWSKILTDWPNIWQSFQRNFQGLLAQSQYMQNKPADVRAEYDAMVRKGSELYQRMFEINASVEKIKGAWNTFTGWLKGVTGLSGLGILPAIPVLVSAAVAASVIYSAGAWLREASQYARKIETMKSLEAKGVAPAEAARAAGQMVETDAGPSLFGIPVKWILVGIVGLLVVPPVVKMFRGN